MSLGNDFVLRGPPMEPIPNISLGEHLFQKIKLLPQDHIIQVDGDTGATQTVGELLEMSARLSRGLRNLGLKVEDVVGMMCRNCFEATAIVLGCWLAGMVVVPIDSNMKVAEIKYAVELTEPKVIFCEERAVNNTIAAIDLLSVSPTVILVADSNVNLDKPRGVRLTFCEILAEIDLGSFVPQSVDSPSTRLIAILFSSGSSGLPKGVGITHTNFIFQTFSMKLLSPFAEDMDFLQISQFIWVTAHLFFLYSLTSGMKRVMLRNPTELTVLKAIDQYKPKWSMMPPLFALSFATHPDFHKYDVSSVQHVVVGGSPFTSSLGEKLMKLWKGVRFIQCYGTTELSGTGSIADEGDLYALGKVAPGVELQVVDVVTGKPLEANTVGEIWLRSPGVMRCYVNNEKSTKEALTEDGWLRTGDLGYYDNLKQVYLVDRRKEMVKITSMQVAPVEVENTILSVPGIIEAFVTGVTHDGDVHELMALVVKQKNSNVTEEIVQAHIAETLSEYKLPTAGVYFVESLPKTSTGKLKRSDLRKTAQELYSSQSH